MAFAAKVLVVTGLALCAIGSSGAVSAQAEAESPVQIAIGKSRRLLDGLNADALSTRYSDTGRDLGKLVDIVRQGDPNVAQLEAMQQIIDQLRERTQTHLERLEARAGRDEAALETLYRSVEWDEMSFALAAFPYWRAWIDLEMSRRVDDQKAKDNWLWTAKRGFRGTAMQVFRPSLVYGGWLGLGYIASAERDPERAIQIFESLAGELGNDSNHPLHEIVTLELRILRAKAGQVTGPIVQREFDEIEAKLLFAEAVALFEYATEYQLDAIDAVNRVNRLVENDYIDDSLLSLVSKYHEKVARYEIGVLTTFVRAEQLYEQGHDEPAAKQYEKFFPIVEHREDLNLTQYYFKYSISALNSNAFHRAAIIAERLLKQGDLSPTMKRASTKIAYVARASKIETHTPATRSALIKAAERLLREYPDDKDADGARLTIARTTTNSKKAHAMMNAVESPRKLKGSLEQTRFFVIAQDFSRGISSTGNAPAVSLAKKGIEAFEDLPKEKREIFENRAIMVQMRAVADPEITEVMLAIDEIEGVGGLSPSLAQGMLWARLHCLARVSGKTAFIDYLGELAKKELRLWQIELIYPKILALKDPEKRITAAQALRPGATAHVRMAQRLEILVIEALLELERFNNAYQQARAFREAYPQVGDAYRLFAVAAAKADRPIEADRAWQAITERSNPTREIWWEGMLQRVQIRATSTRPESSCKVFSEIERRSEFMPEDFKPQVEALRGTLPCATEQPS
ncbi:MAG: hypothetical protein AAF384_13690 [Pseudomonadota bacterium]